MVGEDTLPSCNSPLDLGRSLVSSHRKSSGLRYKMKQIAFRNFLEEPVAESSFRKLPRWVPEPMGRQGLAEC